ncbi:gliding motility-associated C-terminal domain-containing protein [Chitinophaga sp. HK235]|uniref:Ig-like domain-containing protein n=1 Tax=Chitinophaga sp. HK235 TaxID=2952571 RepID=UPI001BA9AAED|nr:gliding motility-associated C-terminal domain-containing protein [Chitinophaga sp. HK235]
MNTPVLRSLKTHTRFVLSSLLSLLLFFGMSQQQILAQTQTQRVYATSEDHNQTPLLCTVCSVTNPGNAVDQGAGFLNTFSTINSTVALLGAQVYQEMIFPAAVAGTQGSIVKVGTGALLTLNLLGNITVQAYNGATPVGSPVLASNSVLSLLASGNQAEIFVPAPGGTYDRLRVTISTAVANVASSINVYAAYYNTPASGVISCNTPIDVLSGVNGNLVGVGSVTNPGNAIDGDTATFAQMFSAVGSTLTDSYVQMTAIYPGLSKAGDSVRIITSNSGALLSIQLLNATTILTYNQGVLVDSVPANSVNVKLDLLGSGASALQTLTFASSGPFDHIQVRFGAVVSGLATLNVNEIQRFGPSPATVGGVTKITCLNTSPFTLDVSNPDNTNYNYTWYNASMAVVGTGSSFSPPTNVAGTFQYYVSATLKVCSASQSAKAPVTVIVNNFATAADITVPASTTSCGDTARIKPTSSTATRSPIFKWYFDINKTTPITNGLVQGSVHFFVDNTGQLTVTGLTAPSTTYYVSVSDSGHCENQAGALAAATVTVGTSPAPPLTATGVSGFTGQTITLTASAPGGTIEWYTDTTASPIATGPSFSVGPFATPTTQIYYVGVRLPGGCTSARVKVTVTVTTPVTPTSCNAPTTQLNGTTFGCLLCSVTNPGNDIDNDPNNFTQLNVPIGLLGGAAFQQLIFPQPGAATDSVQFVIGLPNGISVTLLGGIVLTVANGTTVLVRDTLNNQALTLRLLDSARYVVTIPATGVFDRVEVKAMGLVSLLSQVNIYGARIISPNPTAFVQNQQACVGSTATLNATVAPGTSVIWYADSTTTTALGPNPYTTPVLTTPGTITYWAQVIGTNGCPNPDRLKVVLTVNPLGTAADINIADTIFGCVNSTAVLHPTSTTVTSPVFSWYKDANKDSVISNGLIQGSVHYTVDSVGNLTITGLTAGNYSYYVAVAGINRCQNAAGTLKKVVVHIGSAPAPPVVTGDVIVTTGQQATLTATPVPGATINWYTDSTTTTIAGTGSSFVVGPFSQPGTYTYFAAVSIPGGCTSARVRVNVQVTGPVTPSPDCNVPTSQVSGTTLGCILCSVINPTNDIDSSQTNFTTLNIPLGLLGGSVFQQLIFPNPGAAGDSIRFTMATPAGLANLSLFGGVVVSQYNGATLVHADTLSNVISLRLLTAQQFNATVRAAGTFDRVEVRITGIANLLNSIDIYGVRIVYANPTINTTNDTVCVGRRATLTVTPAAGTTVRWYADSTSTTVLSTQPSYTTDTLRTAGVVTYYVQVVGTNGCANPDRVPVKVIVSPSPAVPGPDQTLNLCPGTSAVLAVPTPNHSFTYNWYNVPTGGTKLNTDSGYVFNVPNITRDTSFYVEAVSSCGNVSPREAFHIVMSSTLSGPVVTPNPDTVQIGTQAVLHASSSAANVIFKWYGSQTGNDSLFTGPVFAPPTQNTPGTVTYWVQATIANTCSSIRVPAVVVYSIINTPTPVPCEGATTYTVGSDGLVILGNVYNPQLAVDNDASTAATLVMDAGLLGADIWEKVGFNGLSAPGDTVRVLVSNPSTILSLQLLGGIQLTTYNGNAPGDSVLINNPLVSYTLLGTGNQAIIEFVPTHIFDAVQLKLKSGILGALTEIGFNYAQRALVKPSVQASQLSVCAGNTATLNVLSPVTGITYRWYTSNGTYLTGKDGISFTTGPLTSDTSFFVEAFRNGCASKTRTRIDIKVGAVPAAPSVLSTDVEVCSGSNAELAISNPLPGYSYHWFNVPTGGSKLNTDSGFTFTVVNVTAPATYYVEAMNDSCGTVSATRTAVNVTIAASLPAPTVTPQNDTVVVNQQPVFTASSTSANAQFYWFNSPTSTDTLFKGAVYAAPASPVPGTITYWVEAAVPGAGSCTSARVSVNAITIIPGSNPVPCEAATTYTVGSSGLLILGNVYNPQLAVDTSTLTYSSLVIDLGLLNASVWERAYFNGLSTPGDTVKVLLTSPSQILSVSLLGGVQLTAYNGNTPGDSVMLPSPALNLVLLNSGHSALLSFVPSQPFNGVEVKLKSGILGALNVIGFNYAQRALVRPTIQVNNATICQGQQATLSVVNPAAGITYSWYDNLNNHLLDSIAFVTPANLSVGTHIYTARASRNGCTSVASAPIQVTVVGTPAKPVPVSDSVTVCAGTAATLSVTPVAGVTFNWYDAATGGAKLASDTNTYMTPANLAVGTYKFYVEAVNGNSCTNTGGRAVITLTVTSASTAADIIIANDTICAGDTAVLTPTSITVPNPVFKWYANPDKTGPITTGVSGNGILTIPGLSIGTHTYYVSVSSAGHCENAAGDLKAVTVTVVGRPAIPVPVSDSVTACLGTSVTLSVTPVAGVTFNWYNAATGGILLASNINTITTPANLAVGTYKLYVEAVNSNSCTNTGGRAVITLTVTSASTAADIIIANDTICAGDTAILTPTSITVPNPVFKWYANPDKTGPITTGVSGNGVLTIPGLSIGTHTYYVSVSSAGRCENAAGDLKAVTVTVVGRPTIPVPVSDSVTACVGTSATLSVTPVPGVTFNWYDAATGGTKLASNTNTYTTPANLAVGTYKFYVEAVNSNSCTNTGGRAVITLTVTNASTAADIIIANETICAGDTAVLTPTSITVPNPVFKWYANPDKTGPITTGVSGNGVLTIPGLTTGTHTYYVSVSSAGRCENAAGDLKAVTVTVNRRSTAADIIISDTTVCASTTVMLTATTTTVTNPVFKWYQDASLQTLLHTGATFTTPVITANTTFYVTVEGSNSCANPAGAAKAVTVSLTSLQAPSVSASSTTICPGDSVVLSVVNPVNGLTYRWYTVPTGGTAVFTGPVYVAKGLTITTDFYVEVSSEGCIGTTRTKITITVRTAPTPELVADNVTACEGVPATLEIFNPDSGLTYNWYTTPTGGTPIFTGPVFVTPPLSTTTKYYVEAVGNGGTCGTPSARVMATVTVVQTPPAPVVTPAVVNTCGASSVTLTIQNPQPHVHYQWQDDNGNLLFTGTQYTFIADSTTIIYVRGIVGGGCPRSCGGCPGPRTAIPINITAAPPAPVLSASSLTVCPGGTVTFNVQNPIGGLTYNWFDAPSGGNLLSTGTSYTTGPLTTNTTFYVAASSNGGCSSARTSASVIVINSVDAPQADPVTVCAGQTTTLSVKNRIPGLIYNWYTVATGGTPVFTGADFMITPTGSTVYYLEAATNGGCVSASRTAVNVNVNPAPAVPVVANATLTTCLNQTVTLSVQNPDPTLTYNWYTSITGGTPVSTGASFTTPPITANTMYYVEAVNNTGCPSATRAAVSIQLITAPAAPTVTGNENGICPGHTATLTASSTTPGVNFNWYTVPTGGTPVFTGAVFTTPVLNNTTTYYVEAFSNGGCVGAGPRTAVTVTMLQPLPAPHVVISDLTATSVTFRWDPVPGAVRYEVTLDGGVTFNPPSSGPTGTTHTINNLQPNQGLNFGVRAIGASDCQTSGLGTLACRTSNPQGNNIFIPNLFSPNGDGMNDVLFVYGTAVAQLEFRVYNQWGQLVFSSKDLHQGWDGTMNGQNQPVGVYVYIVKATMQDGSVVTKKGNVTLMR